MSLLPQLAKALVRTALQRVPSGLLLHVTRAKRAAWRRLALLGLDGRVVRISEGVGAGLRFRVGREYLRSALGTNEAPVQRALAEHLRPGQVFYDVGANVGFFSLLAARLVGPGGHVYAFEPGPHNAAAVREHAALNDFSQIVVLEAAVAATSGEAELLLARHTGGHTLASVGAPPDADGALAVETVALDELVEASVIAPPSCLKIDVEGAEMEALRGLERIVRACRPSLVIEVDAADRGTFDQRATEIRSHLEARGYRVAWLDPSYPDSGWHVGHLLALAAPDST